MRSIPTGVGEPRDSYDSRYARQVYPHRCGGTAYPETGYWPTEGLSPQVWGNPLATARVVTNRRSIPTGVGEPQRPDAEHHQLKVYPHRCGGTLVISFTSLVNVGLSPQVWGNRPRSSQRHYRWRSIPTGVGEPRQAKRDILSPRVYPHRCGGTDLSAFQCGVEQGLSPQVWGNPYRHFLRNSL